MPFALLASARPRHVLARLLPGLLLAAAGCTQAPASTPPTTSGGLTPLAVASPSVLASFATVASPQEGIRELQATIEGLRQAQQALQGGDRAKATDLVNTAISAHYQRVTGFLDQRVGRSYREQLDATLTNDLARRLRDGTASNTEILALFPVAFEKLADAQQNLAEQL